MRIAEAAGRAGSSASSGLSYTVKAAEPRCMLGERLGWLLAMTMWGQPRNSAVIDRPARAPTHPPVESGDETQVLGTPLPALKRRLDTHSLISPWPPSPSKREGTPVPVQTSPMPGRLERRVIG